MTTLAVLPIKSFDSAKQRLGATLGAGSRQALARSMFADVLASLRHVPGLDAVVVITADREAESAATGENVSTLRDVHQDGQSAAARIGIDHAMERGIERVLLVPGDTPLLDPAEVRALLSRSAARPVTIVPDRHGTGTNALVLSPPDAIGPAFGPDSRRRHVEAAEAAGLDYEVDPVPSLVHDVDTPDDLTELSRLLETHHGRAPQTRGTLMQIDRLQASAESPVRA